MYVCIYIYVYIYIHVYAYRALDGVAFLRPCWRGTNEADKHLVCAPELLLTGNSIGAIRQGQLADGWLLGAVAAVATQPKLLNHLLVDWSEEWGVFTFRVFKDGKWRHVTVDDRLPAKKDSRTCLFAVGVDAVTLEGQQGKRAERVMWVALFEKAYAKAHGCYAQLAKGAVPYALKDLTAGAPQACCMCLPYTSALYVCLICLPCTSASRRARRRPFRCATTPRAPSSSTERCGSRWWTGTGAGAC